MKYFLLFSALLLCSCYKLVPTEEEALSLPAVTNNPHNLPAGERGHVPGFGNMMTRQQ